MGDNSRRFALAVVGVQALGTALSLPVLGSFRVERVWPLQVTPIFRPEPIPPNDLGFAWGTGVVPPDQRSLEGLATVAGVWLVLGLLGLAIACATLAVLFVRRGSERHAEIAVHAAVGANRATLARALLREPVALTGVAAVLGGILGALGWISLRVWWPDGLGPPATQISPLALLAITSPCLVVIVAALYPLRHLRAWMRTPGRARTSGALWERTVLASYVASLVVFLALAGLLIRAQGSGDRRALSAPYVRDTLLVELRALEDFDARATLDALSSLPAARGASLVSTGTLRGVGMTDATVAECQCSSGGLPAPYVRMSLVHHVVSPGFFSQMGIPVRRGREFAVSDDDGHPLVAVVNEALAARIRGGDPLAARIRVGGRDVRGPWYSIIGVVPNLSPPGLGTRGQPAPSVYLSSFQHTPSAPTLLIRATVPGRLEPEIRSILGRLAPDAELARVTTLEKLLERWGAPLAWFAGLTALLGVGMLALAVQGLHGAIALDVWRRTGEIGLRRALGATRRDIMRMIVVETVRTATPGLLLGVAVAVGFARGLEVAMPGIRPFDPTLYAVIGVILIVAALGAACVPAYRAGLLDPAPAIASRS